MSGYSDTPLLRKLGWKTPMKVLLIAAPADYVSWLGEVPQGIAFLSRLMSNVEAVHLFVTEATELDRLLKRLRVALRPDGFVWVSWPKRASGIPTDVTENRIRDLALPLGFVDVKVCAVSEVWSGLKLMIRRSERVK